jgi:8-oxo-dGTP pyrophosphatase MutT (NUDIX family)
MESTGEKPIPQAAVLPVRAGRVCLVTSREGKNWLIPKGRIGRGKTAGEAALLEAWEEAGLTGYLDREPVGAFLFEKLGKSYHVTIFLMHVTEARKNYPEREVRERRWVRVERAAKLVTDPGLKKVLRGIFAIESSLVRG